VRRQNAGEGDRRENISGRKNKNHGTKDHRDWRKKKHRLHLHHEKDFEGEDSGLEERSGER